MDIGKPVREIIVEPLEMPEPLRQEPSALPDKVAEPVEEPVAP